MDNIFIDTSIFESNNFLESKRIKQILKLAEEEYIQIVLPAITYNETKNRATKNIKEAISRFKKYRDETRVLRNVNSIKEKFELIDENECVKEFLEIFESNLKKAKCNIIDYPTVNIKDIFEKYFGDEFPFSRGEKKHEFPDAFALLSVEMWCKENKKKCYVFSNDKDLLNYKSTSLIIVSSYEQYLDNKLRELETHQKQQKRLERVTKIYEFKKFELELAIEDWIHIELDDFSTYYSYTDQEVHNIDIKDTKATLSDFQIISINDNEITIEAEAEIYYHVEVEIDDENSSYYDSDDKVRVYFNTVTSIIEQRQIIPVQLKVDIPLAGEEYIDIEIDEINHGRGLSLLD